MGTVLYELDHVVSNNLSLIHDRGTGPPPRCLPQKCSWRFSRLEEHQVGGETVTLVLHIPAVATTTASVLYLKLALLHMTSRFILTADGPDTRGDRYRKDSCFARNTLLLISFRLKHELYSCAAFGANASFDVRSVSTATDSIGRAIWKRRQTR